jgi:hypothetical protein
LFVEVIFLLLGAMAATPPLSISDRRIVAAIT